MSNLRGKKEPRGVAVARVRAEQAIDVGRRTAIGQSELRQKEVGQSAFIRALDPPEYRNKLCDLVLIECVHVGLRTRGAAVARMADELLAALDRQGTIIRKWRQLAIDDLFEFVSVGNMASGLQFHYRSPPSMDAVLLRIDDDRDRVLPVWGCRRGFCLVHCVSFSGAGCGFVPAPMFTGWWRLFLGEAPPKKTALGQ